jgi:hypothetical protein
MEFEKMDTQLEWFKLPKTEWTTTYWAFINIIVSHYRPEQMTDEAKTAFVNTMLNFRYLLPCPKCRAHFEDHIRTNPIEHYLDKRDGLIEWIKPVLERTKNQPKIIKTQTTPITTQKFTPKINHHIVPIIQSSEINDNFSRNKITFIQTPPEQHKKRGPFVKVPQVTEEIVSTVIEGIDGKKISIKRKRPKEMTFKEYVQYRVETNPHVSACNCG